MTLDHLRVCDSLSEYALSTYSLPGVSQSCLCLQERAGVDVTVLLYTMFLASCRSTALDQDGISKADAEVAHWRAQVVSPLRSIRNLIKDCDELSRSQVVNEAREMVKKAELAAEMAALDLLSQRVAIDSVGVRTSTTQERLVSRVTHFYASKYRGADLSIDKELEDAMLLLDRHSVA